MSDVGEPADLGALSTLGHTSGQVARSDGLGRGLHVLQRTQARAYDQQSQAPDEQQDDQTQRGDEHGKALHRRVDAAQGHREDDRVTRPVADRHELGRGSVECQTSRGSR